MPLKIISSHFTYSTNHHEAISLNQTKKEINNKRCMKKWPIMWSFDWFCLFSLHEFAYTYQINKLLKSNIHMNSDEIQIKSNQIIFWMLFEFRFLFFSSRRELLIWYATFPFIPLIPSDFPNIFLLLCTISIRTAVRNARTMMSILVCLSDWDT